MEEMIVLTLLNPRGPAKHVDGRNWRIVETT